MGELNKTEKLARLLLLLGANGILLFILTFAASSFLGKRKFGEWLPSTKTRDSKLSFANCKEFSCLGFTDFNTARKSSDDRVCVLTNPVFGYTNTCLSGSLGMPKETVKRKPLQTYRLAIVGGSVAHGLIPYFDSYLRNNRKLLPDRYDETEVFGLALGGAKQPMQLQGVNALLSMGYEFDAIVNIAGWNEIALGAVENFNGGMPVLYPRGHVDRIILEQRSLLNDGISERCKAFDKPLGWHPAYILYSYSCIKRMRSQISSKQDYQNVLTRLNLSASSEPKHDRLDAALRAWAKSSINLSAISRVNGIQYLEVIQPSLNHSQSKLHLTDEEAAYQCRNKKNEIADSVNAIFSTDLRSHFPRDLISVLDLRFIFASSNDKEFIDCVHLSESGNQKVVDRVVRELTFK